jgi:hypothetical protein
MNSLPINSVDLRWLQPYMWVNIALCVFLAMLVIFSLLTFRQARQMTEVLPTLLSPSVHLVVILYIIVTIVACFLGVGIIVSSL